MSFSWGVGQPGGDGLSAGPRRWLTALWGWRTEGARDDQGQRWTVGGSRGVLGWQERRDGSPSLTLLKGREGALGLTFFLLGLISFLLLIIMSHNNNNNNNECAKDDVGLLISDGLKTFTFRGSSCIVGQQPCNGSCSSLNPSPQKLCDLEPCTPPL